VSKKSVLIIGAGLAGLAAGCYCQMNNYHTRIFELHNKPGGVATAWKRKDYIIDGGIHFIMDHKPGQPTYELYRELGAAQKNPFVDLNVYGRFYDQPTGKIIDISGDLDRVDADLKALFPEDAREIASLLAGARAMQRDGMDGMDYARPPELSDRWEGLRPLWGMRKLFRYFTGKYAKSAAKYAQDLHHPTLGQVIQYLFMPEVPVWFVMMILGMCAEGRLGLLESGSLDFAMSIEQRYQDLGGQVIYNAAVEEILVEENRAVGVRLADGREYRADIIVSAADGYSTIFKLLGGRYLNDKIKKRYTEWKLCSPSIMVSFGVAREFPETPPFNTIFLDRSLAVGGHNVDRVFLRIFNYSSKSASPGKTVVQVEFETEWDYWHNLRKEDHLLYKTEKERIAGEVLNVLEKLYPGISSQVEVTDVATPYTTWRYTRNHQGASMAWLYTPELMTTVMERTLPGLKNFYMAGQWVVGASVPGCLYSGRHITEILCRREGKQFQKC
jgi:phytoene desaturase